MTVGRTNQTHGPTTWLGQMVSEKHALEARQAKQGAKRTKAA